MLTTLKAKLNTIGIVAIILISVCVVGMTNYFLKSFALKNAEQYAVIILKHNLAIHRYFNQQLKPSIFPQVDAQNDREYFEPTWMSSTYAVREIDKHFSQSIGHKNYYKEAAINARSPENEADGFERDFIRRLNAGNGPDTVSGVRNINGEPFFFTMIRGEAMEEGCLRCHSTPAQAPQGMVARYGAQRSFNRSANEVVSAISIHVPLEQEFHEANLFSFKLSAGLLLTLSLLLITQNRLYQRLIMPPLNAIRSEARRITETPELIGSQIPLVYTAEMNDLGSLFNSLSSRLKSFVDDLEATIDQRTQEARTNEQRYRLLFENMTSGFALHAMILDEQGGPADYRFLEINPAFEQLTGLNAAATVGRTVLELMPQTERSWIETYGQVAAGGEPIMFENFSASLGKHFMVWAFCNKPGQFATLFSDITTLKQYQQTIEEKNAELERFTYMVSHDLKSPLVTISTFLGYLEQDLTASDQDRIRQDMAYMTTAADKMNQLLAELLEFSRVGRSTATRAATTYQQVTDEALQLLAGPLSTCQVQVTRAPRDLTLVGDRARLVEIWQNLLENGVKYRGQENHPEIELGWEIRNEEAIFFVRDNGAGIDARYHDRIFGLFEKLDPGSDGSGLGLAMVKRVVEMYGGRIWVESAGAGLGSCFHFTLPKAVQTISERTAVL